ncbi:MAG: hypothetical protein JWR80_4497 [Bradyrhizobium sp.]|nr:hypothetical protein [Bradyrhizobium sp.]
MKFKRLRIALAGAALAVAVIAAGVFLLERDDARSSLQRQMDAVETDLELSASRLTRDLTQQVAVVQGLVALVSGQPELTAETFANYTRNFRRGRDNLRRVMLIRDGKVLYSDRPPFDAESFPRIERRVAPSEPTAQAALQKGAVVINGPFKTSDKNDVFLYARPIFLGDGKVQASQFWGFAGILIDDDAIICPVGLCEPKPKNRVAIRIAIDDAVQKPFTGDVALFEPDARVARAFSSIPGARIEFAAMPANGWTQGAPNRWIIRAAGAALGLFAVGLILLLASARTGRSVRTRAWAAAGSTGVLLLVLGFAAVLDKLEAERESHLRRDEITDQLERAASHATRDISDDVAVIQNLSTFVEADPNFTDVGFERYAERIRQLHPRIVSLRLARDGKLTHISPPEPDRIGADMRQTPEEGAAIERSINSGTPLLAGPFSFGHGEAFIYRQPIYIGDGPPSRERLWGVATILIDRNAVICPLGACTQPPTYRQALRLVIGQAPQPLVPQPPFAGDASMFDANSDAAKIAVRIPGGRIEMAAVPVDGWSAVTGLRWLIWAIAIPLALLASARLLLVFFGMPSPMLRVYTGLLMVLVGGVLALLRQDLVGMLAVAGISNGAVVTPLLVALIAFATAYTINAALSAFVWPEQPVGRVDSLQRAPSILRHFLATLLYATAGLWVASYAFDLDLHGIGLTSGAAGIIVGFATQKLILDFFSGVMLGIERPFAIGDWIELKTEGVVVTGVIYEMTWRTAQIRNSNLDLVTIPNSVLAQATVINRSRPNRWTEVAITFGVGADVASDRVETIVMAAIQPLIGDVLVGERQPNLRATAIKGGDIDYSLNVYGTLGPGSEQPIADKVLRAMRTAFETAGIKFG